MQKLSLTRQYATYSEYKDSGIEWLGDIPQSWMTESSKRVFREKNIRGEQGLELGSVTQDKGVVLRSESDLSVWNPQGETGGYKTIRTGQFVLSLRSFEGGVEYSEVDALVSPAYTVMSLSNEHSERYFKWLLKSDNIISALQIHTRGIRQGKNISFQDFSAIDLAIPPKTEQEKIARFLDEQTARIDETITKKQKLIELLKEKRTATINHAVTKGIDPKAEHIDSGIDWVGKIPKGWEKVPLGHLLSYIQPGPYITDNILEEKTEKSVPVLTANKGFILGYTDDESGIYSVDLPVVIFDDFTTSTQLVRESFKVRSSALKILKNKNHKLSDIRYVFYCMHVQDFYVLEHNRHWIAMYQKEQIPLPDIETQNIIADHIDGVVERYQKAVANVEKSITLLQELKSSLISHAVTGKIKI